MRPLSDRPRTRMKRNDATTGAATVCVQSLSTRRISRPPKEMSPAGARAVQAGGPPSAAARLPSKRSRRHRLHVYVGERVGFVGLQQPGRTVTGDQAPASDQGDVLAELLRLLKVMGGEQDRGRSEERRGREE